MFKVISKTQPFYGNFDSLQDMTKNKLHNDLKKTLLYSNYDRINYKSKFFYQSDFKITSILWKCCFVFLKKNIILKVIFFTSQC